MSTITGNNEKIRELVDDNDRIAIWSYNRIKELEAELAGKVEAPAEPAQPSDRTVDVHVAFIIGHTDKSEGAYSRELKTSEYDYYTEMFGHAKSKEHQAFNVKYRTFTRDSGGIVGAYGRAQDWLESKGADETNGAIVELHFNAFNGKANYTVTMYDADGDKFGNGIERKLADAVSRGFSKDFNVRMISSWDRNSGQVGYFNVSRALDYPSILIEPFFGDNAEMARKFADKGKVRNSLLSSLSAFYEA